MDFKNTILRLRHIVALCIDIYQLNFKNTILRLRLEQQQATNTALADFKNNILSVACHDFCPLLLTGHMSAF